MFADLITARTVLAGSCVVAGFDPRLEAIPTFIINEASSKSTHEDKIYHVLRRFHLLALETLKDHIAAIKPNIAFFEQYGIGGLRALRDICVAAESASVPVIMDAKRGDIGSTAEAYATAFLGSTSAFGGNWRSFPSNAITLNPFLGFDTLEPFMKECAKNQHGVFVLVKTSNPGSGDIQNITNSKNSDSISITVAKWLAENATRLMGKSGLSSLGAVIGATYPEEATVLRSIMPTNLFLVPGYGAQGATAEDVLPNFTAAGNGALINVSRALLSSFSSLSISEEECRNELTAKIETINNDLNGSLARSRQAV